MNPLKIFKYVFTLFTLSFSFAQNQDNTWYFGGTFINQTVKGAGLDFNNLTATNPNAMTNSGMQYTEGSACISDVDGHLLFYTSGLNVYNKCHELMTNGSGLAGHSSSMFGALIAPNPANGNQYYIFANDGHPTGTGAGLSYSLVDMTLDNDKGAVLAAGKNTPLVTNTSEFLQGAHHSNGTDFWAITIDEPSVTGNAMRIYAYRISATGVSAPVVSTLPASVIDNSYDVAWFKISPNSKKAVVWVSSQSTAVRKNLLLDFNNATGVFTYNATFGLLDATVRQDTRKGGFSPDSQYYYAGKMQTPYTTLQTDLVQYPIAGLNETTVPVTIGLNTGEIDDIRVGPDKKAYVLLDNDSFNLSRINTPNMAGIACDFQRGIIPLAGKAGSVTLPNTFLKPNIIIPTVAATISISSNPDPATVCTGESISFTATIANASTPNYQWQIDGVDVPGATGVTFLSNTLITGQVVTCKIEDRCLTVQSNGIGVTVAPCPSSSIDFDGINDYINRAPLLGDKGSVSMMSWIKLDAGFSGGDIMGQGNYRLFVDSNDQLRAQINEGGVTTAVTYQLNMLDDLGDGWTAGGVTGNLAVFANGVQVTGSPFTLANGFNSSINFTANIGDVITMEFLSDNYPNEMSFNIVNISETGTPQVFPATGNYEHTGGPQTTENINPGFTASCLACTSPIVSYTTPVANAPILTEDLWLHVATIYNGAAGTMQLYLNGELQDTRTGISAVLTANTYDFEIGRRSDTQTHYFKGAIYESRVYDVALTENQLREQIYQEIKNNNGKVHGNIIPKDIDGGALNWPNLILYYKMANISNSTTSDGSNSAINGVLNNMTTTQPRTAPMPYVANASGKWTTVDTWQNGGQWDITNLPNRAWAIVQVTNNAKVTTTASHTHLGVVIDNGAELEIQNNQLLNNTSYLRLDGVIDLEDESQLIQTASSKLDAASAGYIERDQQGKADIYSYNHWSSPVGAINTMSNNADFTVAGILKDGSNAANPQNINFVGGYDGAAGAPISIADFWIFKFANHPDDYNAWYDGHVKSTGSISVGEGYTQKGTGTAGSSQNYVFVGKPNNGVIQRNVDSDNLYLVGNPYPSALDANQFILDNITTTTGTLYFWEHWGGASHALADYQGGYATYNLTGATMAVPDPDVAQVGSGSVLPKQYVAIAQGFFVKGSATGGAIEFNNGQRAFQKESGGNSVFISTNASTPMAPPMAPPTPAADDIDRVYFRFTTPEGAERQLLLGVKEGLAEGFNNGYDGEMIYQQRTDCAWKIGNTPFVIQAIGELYDELELPLEIKMGTTGVAKFETEGLEDLPENVKVFFVDKVANTYTELQTGIQAEINVENGVHNDRYYVVFKVQDEVLAVEETVEAAEGVTVFYQAASQSINIVSANTFKASGVTLYNVLGQQVMNFGSDFNNVQELKLPVNVAAGTYVLRFLVNDHEVTKKIMITN